MTWPASATPATTSTSGRPLIAAIRATVQRSSFLGARLKRRDSRQRLAFEEFQERAARGGDVADPVGDAELVDRGDGVAAAGDRKGLRTCDGTRKRFRALGELVDLEHAHRAVPHDSTRALHDLRELRRALRADVEDHLVAFDR